MPMPSVLPSMPSVLPSVQGRQNQLGFRHSRGQKGKSRSLKQREFLCRYPRTIQWTAVVHQYSPKPAVLPSCPRFAQNPKEVRQLRAGQTEGKEGHRTQTPVLVLGRRRNHG